MEEPITNAVLDMHMDIDVDPNSNSPSDSWHLAWQVDSILQYSVDESSQQRGHEEPRHNEQDVCPSDRR